jgi:glycosyltransferase involved in cell wall biosynthesis
MKVSVIIPTFNCEKFIESCLDSLLKQNFLDFEIIIVDNHSSDNTIDKINFYIERDNRISLIKLDDNYKQGIARNIGVEHSKGDYIMFVDGDDKVSPDFINHMYNKIVTDNSDMTICRWAPFDNLTGKVNRKHGYSNFHRLPEKYLKQSFTWRDIKDEVYSQSNVPWDKIYKKSFLIADKITVLDECLIYYRVNRKQAVTARCDKTFFDYLKIFDCIKQNLINQGLYDEMKYNFLNYKVRSIFWWWKKIDFKYKKEFFNLIKKDYIKMYNTELAKMQDKREIWTKTFFLINRVLDNKFLQYMFFLYWDRIFRIEYGVDNHKSVLLSNFEWWNSNYDGKKLNIK